jgi:hypothetical protein
LRFAERWEETWRYHPETRDLMIFPSETGGPMNRNNLHRRQFRPLAEKAALPNEALVYTALTVVLAGVYQAIDAALHYLLITLTHQHSLVGSIVSALVVATLFHPVRHRIQHFVDGHLSSGESGGPGHSDEVSRS